MEGKRRRRRGAKSRAGPRVRQRSPVPGSRLGEKEEEEEGVETVRGPREQRHWPVTSRAPRGQGTGQVDRAEEQGQGREEGREGGRRRGTAEGVGSVGWRSLSAAPVARRWSARLAQLGSLCPRPHRCALLSSAAY